ncbi:MAG: hypothetical protein ACK59R_04065 [Pseudomonadota bacterium]
MQGIRKNADTEAGSLRFELRHHARAVSVSWPASSPWGLAERARELSATQPARCRRTAATGHGAPDDLACPAKG